MNKKTLLPLIVIVFGQINGKGYTLKIYNNTNEPFKIRAARLNAITLSFAISGMVVGAATGVGGAVAGALGAGPAGAIIGGIGAGTSFVASVTGFLEGGWKPSAGDVLIKPYQTMVLSTGSKKYCWGQLKAYHLVKDKNGKVTESPTLWLEKNRGKASIMCQNFTVIIDYAREDHDVKDKKTGKMIRKKGDPIPDLLGNMKIHIKRHNEARNFVKKYRINFDPVEKAVDNHVQEFYKGEQPAAVEKIKSS